MCFSGRIHRNEPGIIRAWQSTYHSVEAPDPYGRIPIASFLVDLGLQPGNIILFVITQVGSPH